MTRQFLTDAEKPATAETVLKIEELLNAAPMSCLGMDTPVEAMRLQVTKLVWAR